MDTSPQIFLFLIIFCNTTLFTSFVSSASLTYGDFEHYNLKFVAFHNPPYDTFIRGPNNTFTYKGASLQIVQWMAAKLKFSFTIVPIDQSLIEKYGTHEASFYHLLNDKDVDGIACAFYLTSDRIERMDFTFMAWSEGFRLIVPRPGEESRLFAFIGPFKSSVWLLILISINAIVGMMTFFGWFYKRHYFDISVDSDSTTLNQNAINYYGREMSPQDLLSSISSHTVYIFNIIGNQGCKESFSRCSFRVLLGGWLLSAMVLVNSYSGVVTSSLTVPRMKPTIDSLEDLAASKDVGIVLRHDVSTGEQILKATSGVYKELGDKARRYPDQIVGDPFKLNAKLETGNYAYPFVQTFCFFFVGSQYQKDKVCRFQVSKPLPLSTGYYSLLFKKKSPYTELFSRGLMDLWESGHVRFWVKDVIPRADECFASKNQHTAGQIAIRLTDLTSAFLILGLGLGLATFVFMLECLSSQF